MFASACATTPPDDASASPPLADSYPGELRSALEFQPNGMWRQHVTAAWDEDRTHGFDAVLQRAGDGLTVLGLGPGGSVGFSVVLRGGVIEVVDNMPDGMPFEARFILLDVQRAFYPWLRRSTPSTAPLAAAHATAENAEALVDGEHVRETYADGRVVRRTFERLDGQPAGVIEVVYEWDDELTTLPRRAVLKNGWFGYSLTIETQDETRFATRDEQPPQ